ncbi:MAG: hypothetical protein WCV83_02880 [Candidatus Magasanikbacteria bacterium]
MFRHKNESEQVTENKKVIGDKKDMSTELPAVLENKKIPKTEAELTKDLLEKNLKWSQIIYEQNRKINNKLMWTAVAGWVRVFLILVPLVVAAWFLPPLVKDLQDTYGSLLGGKTTSIAPSSLAPSSIDQLLKILPLDPAKQEQLKALLK